MTGTEAAVEVAARSLYEWDMLAHVLIGVPEFDELADKYKSRYRDQASYLLMQLGGGAKKPGDQSEDQSPG